MVEKTVSDAGFIAPTITRTPITGSPVRYTVEELTHRDDVLRLKEEWRALEKSSFGSVAFQSFRFCLHWLDNYAYANDATHEPKIAAVREPGGRLMALAPWAEKRGGLVRLAEWIGEPLLQYGDILLHPSAEKGAVRRALSDAMGRWAIHGLHLRNVRDDSRIRQVLDLDGGAVGQARQAAFCDMTQYADAEAYFQGFSRSSRKTRRLKRRRLEERGELTFEHLPAGPEAQKIYKTALAWKKAWLEKQGLSSRAFQDDKALAMLEAMTADQASDNPIHVYALYLDQQPISVEISFADAGAVMAFMGMYDPDFEALSPGKIQMESSIRLGFDEGWKGYDLLAPMADYKASWTNTQVGLMDYLLASTVSGLVYKHAFLGVIRPSAKAALMALPTKLRSKILGQKSADT
ncbi:MAG: GNAT family N-acetyltransferase [Pseudomonadota bacterium]